MGVAIGNVEKIQATAQQNEEKGRLKLLDEQAKDRKDDKKDGLTEKGNKLKMEVDELTKKNKTLEDKLDHLNELITQKALGPSSGGESNKPGNDNAAGGKPKGKPATGDPPAK